MKNTLMACLLLLASCAPARRIVYFQDIPAGHTTPLPQARPITVQAEDKISIVVNSKDPELANLFNLPVVSRYLGSGGGATTPMQGSVSGYTVSSEGCIDFPVLGRVSVAGLNREQISTLIKGELVSQSLVKDPVVTVEFINLTVAVLGEVNRPGRYNIDKDRITLLEAIGMAGDLTIYGRRDNVTVVRKEEGGESIHRVDLTRAASLAASPVCYLRQNDVIYVEPNGVRARQSTVNGNNIRSSSFWLSLASLATTLTLIFVK